MPNTANRHFELSELIDYVRKIGSPERLAAIQQHVEVEGCERCRRSASLLNDAYGAARAVAEVDVPDAVVQRAQAIFRPAPAASSAWWRNVPAMALELVSGEWALSPAGLRSAAAQRQRVYASGSVQARVLLETDPEGGRVLVGALSDLADPGRIYAGCPVLLTAGEKVLLQTSTSRYGEFHMELPRYGNLRIILLLEDETRRVEITIDD
jgi:hypothetical protein